MTSKIITLLKRNESFQENINLTLVFNTEEKAKENIWQNERRLSITKKFYFN